MHATGIRVGYCVAPAELTRELRKVHQFNTFSIAHRAAGRHCALSAPRSRKPGATLPAFFQAKRDRLRAALAKLRLHAATGPGDLFPTPGLQRFRARRTTWRFAERLLTEAGVATIPLSPFYAVPPALPVLRLCIAKQDSTLDEAAQRLNEFAARLS